MNLKKRKLEFSRSMAEDGEEQLVYGLKLPRVLREAIAASPAGSCFISFTSESVGVVTVGLTKIPFSISTPSLSTSSPSSSSSSSSSSSAAVAASARECFAWDADGVRYCRTAVLTRRVVIDPPRDAVQVQVAPSVAPAVSVVIPASSAAAAAAAAVAAASATVSVREVEIIDEDDVHLDELLAAPKKCRQGSKSNINNVDDDDDGGGGGGGGNSNNTGSRSKHHVKSKALTPMMTSECGETGGVTGGRGTPSPWVCVEGLPVTATGKQLSAFFGDTSSTGLAGSIDAAFSAGAYTAADGSLVTDVYVVFITADGATNALLYNSTSFFSGHTGAPLCVRPVDSREACVAKGLGVVLSLTGVTSVGDLQAGLQKRGVPRALLELRVASSTGDGDSDDGTHGSGDRGCTSGLYTSLRRVLAGDRNRSLIGVLNPGAIQGSRSHTRFSSAGSLKGYGLPSAAPAAVGTQACRPTPFTASASGEGWGASARWLFERHSLDALMHTSGEGIRVLSQLWAALVLASREDLDGDDDGGGDDDVDDDDDDDGARVSSSTARNWVNRALCLFHLISSACTKKMYLTHLA